MQIRSDKSCWVSQVMYRTSQQSLVLICFAYSNVSFKSQNVLHTELSVLLITIIVQLFRIVELDSSFIDSLRALGNFSFH